MDNDRKLMLLQKALDQLLYDAERVNNKFGHDENDIPSDWSEWVDLRRSIMEVRHAYKRIW